jgi:hypothetical protein
MSIWKITAKNLARLDPLAEPDLANAASASAAPPPAWEGTGVRDDGMHGISPAEASETGDLYYCDCGRLAVTVLTVYAGYDSYDHTARTPVRLPLCPACLKLEQEMWAEK